MKCADAQLILTARIDGELVPVRQQPAFDAHLEACADCRAEQEALSEVAQQVRALPRLTPPVTFAGALLERIASDDGPATGDPAEAGGGGAIGCAATSEAISALLDDAIDADAFDRVREHLDECAACQSDHDLLERLVGLVRGLPTLDAPADFVDRILARIREADRLEAERRRATVRNRRAFLRRLAPLAQAAGLLLILAAGLAAAPPAQHGFVSVPTVGARSPQADRSARPRTPTVEAAPARPLPPGPYDATWRLNVAGSLERGVALARDLLARAGARVETESGGERRRGFATRIRADRVDDVLAALEGSPALTAEPSAWQAMERTHLEADRVTLKNGFVLTGAFRSGRRDASLAVGGTTYPVDRSDVERVDSASALRRVQIVLRSTE